MSSSVFRAIRASLPLLALPAIALAAPPPPSSPPPPAKPSAAPAVPSAAPPVLLAALPARVEFVAWLPATVNKSPDFADLDLRIEVVLPRSCGDKMVGLLRRGGAKLDAPDAFDVVLERNATGECGKDAVRIGARQALRMRLPDGQTRDLQIGDRVLKVARAGKSVTVDGGGPEGDVPGAPPTGRPIVLAAAEVTGAKILAAERAADAQWVAKTSLQVSAKYPPCAGPPLGLLARGDASTRFALTRFEPIARVPLDETCKPTPPRTTTLAASVRLTGKGEEQAISVGNIALVVKLPPAAPKPNAPAAPTAK